MRFQKLDVAFRNARIARKGVPAFWSAETPVLSPEAPEHPFASGAETGLKGASRDRALRQPSHY